MNDAIILLTPARAVQLAERIRELYVQLQGISPEQAKSLLGSLCEQPSKAIVEYAAEEIWTTKDGRRIPIGKMAPEHLAHSLALVVRKGRERRIPWHERAAGYGGVDSCS